VQKWDKYSPKKVHRLIVGQLAIDIPELLSFEPMENFVVSARKYRPTGFDEVVGQEHITTTLKNAIESNKLAQALLFCGPRGVGKTTCARIVARLINGFEEKAETNSLNIFELDAASNNSVEDIRNLIDQVRYPPQFGKFKVYIIDEVHMLSNAAFNAFLKTLEEPPSYAIFILATTEKHKVIPTILSRCQIFDFNRIQISDIANHIKKIAQQEEITVEDEALHLIAQKADGALRDALSIFDLMVTYSSGKGITFKSVLTNLHILDYDYYFQVVDSLLTRNHSQSLVLLDEVLRKGFDGHNFIVGMSEHLRNLLVSQDARTVELMEVPESVRKKYIEQAGSCSPSLLLSWLSIANMCDINYKLSKNQRLSVELALMKMAHVWSVVEPGNTSLPASAELKKKRLSKV
jgi:DNA polymerase-3 subunit gamma/tau